MTGRVQHDIVAPDNSRTDSFIYNFEITVLDVEHTTVDLSEVTFEQPANS